MAFIRTLGIILLVLIVSFLVLVSLFTLALNVMACNSAREEFRSVPTYDEERFQEKLIVYKQFCRDPMRYVTSFLPVLILYYAIPTLSERYFSESPSFIGRNRIPILILAGALLIAAVIYFL
ncbi:MAG: hypothetical protein Q8R40_03510 [bacterium]|nr:hypothetical protein [bacterium]